MADEVMPRARAWREAGIAGERPPFLAEVQAKAKAAGLWNLAVPNLPDDAPGQRLSNAAFAPLAEIMGRFMGAPGSGVSGPRPLNRTSRPFLMGSQPGGRSG